MKKTSPELRKPILGTGRVHLGLFSCKPNVYLYLHESVHPQQAGDPVPSPGLSERVKR